MSDKQYQNQLRYRRNTLADAARVDIPVGSLPSIRDPSIDLQAGRIDQKQAGGLINLVEKQLNEKKGLMKKSEWCWEAVAEVQVLLAPFRVSPVPEYTWLSGERGIFYPLLDSGDSKPNRFFTNRRRYISLRTPSLSGTAR